MDEKATGEWTKCFEGPVALPADWLKSATLGLTAATGSLADNHDILRVTVYDTAEDALISETDSDAMLHTLSKEYNQWMQSDSCNLECKLSILQKKIKDFNQQFEHRITDLQEKTQNTVQKLREKERKNQDKILDLEKTVRRLVDTKMSAKMSTLTQEVGRNIETRVLDELTVHSSTWKTPFFLLITGITGGVIYVYRQYQQLRKSHLL